MRASSAACVSLVLICGLSWTAIVNGQSNEYSTITGTVRCGGVCDTVGLSYGSPINAAGRIVAHMTMALDPYTGSTRPDLPTTDAQTSFDASAHGHYELQGLLPGIYDLYAFASGYQTVLVASGVTVHPGQSLSFDAYMTPCPPNGCT